MIFQNILNRLELPVPCPKEEDYSVLINSVNSVRMKNNPVKLSGEAIDMIYHQILEGNY